MTEIEKYIKDNKELLNNGSMPLGHKERFMSKLQVASKENITEHAHKAKSLKIKYFAIAATVFSAAAVLVVALIIGSPSKQESPIEISVINNNIYADEMKQEEQEVIKLIKKLDQNTEEQIINTLDNITFEAIPLSEQLPEELSEDEKAKILKEYYNQKTVGIRKIKMFLAQETAKIEE